MADNDENPEAMQEIILPIRQDGLRTRAYSGSLMLIAGARSSQMPNYGLKETWTCLFARESMTKKFFPSTDDVPIAKEAADDKASQEEVAQKDAQNGTTVADVINRAGDDRALLYSGCANGTRKVKTDEISGFTDGLSLVKWTNLRSDGTAGSDPSWPDTDIPLFRLAEAYLTRAEAKWRKSGRLDDALADINELRRRANTRTLPSITSEMDILDEWCREFYMEGRRRSDLVRFECFAGSKYIWDWKGGVADGTTVDSHFNVYPIPADDIRNNKNLKQNEGY